VKCGGLVNASAFGSAPSVLDRWWSSRDSRLPKSNFVLHRWSPLSHETTLSINEILRASPRYAVVRLIAEQTRSSGFLGGLLRDIFSHKPRSDPIERSTVLRLAVPAYPGANPYLHSICIRPASAARAASFSANGFIERAQSTASNFAPWRQRAYDKALTFVGTNISPLVLATYLASHS
jgi:hypothetical protein